MFRRSDLSNNRNNETPRDSNPSSSRFDLHGRILHPAFAIDHGPNPLRGAPTTAPQSFKATENTTGHLQKLQPIVEKANRDFDFLPEVDKFDIKLPPLDIKGQKRRNMDEDTVTKPDQPKRWNRMMVDLMPGLRAPLVGAKESLEAYRADRCFHTTCTECKTFLYFIITADLVLCPQCKAISPTSKHIPTLTGDSTTLGLGLTVEHLLADPEIPAGHF